MWGITWSTCMYRLYPFFGSICVQTNRNSGPNWIHGTGDNPISTIADSTKTTVEDFNENQVIFSRDGKPLDDELATKASEFVWTTIDEAFEYSNTYKDSISPTRSLFDFFKDNVEKRTDFSTVEKEACLEYGKLWGSYVGDPVEKQSLKFFCLEECLDSSEFPCFHFGFSWS